MQLTLLGVRGSTPAPGPDFVRYGGHTACVAVKPSGAAAPTLVLDAGTGLRGLTSLLAGMPFRGSVVLSHLHWDHFQGIPFFVAGDRDDAEVTVYLPAQDGRTGFELMSQAMSPPAFPITPAGLRGRWTFEAVEPGRYRVQGLEVMAQEVRHKGGRTYGYRVSDGSVSVAYLPDHVARGEVTRELEALVAGVDLLLHDAQFLEPERALADAYGHSTVGDAVALAEALGVGRLVLFHHSPVRTDDALDAIGAGVASTVAVETAREGQVIDVARRPAT